MTQLFLLLRLQPNAYQWPLEPPRQAFFKACFSIANEANPFSTSSPDEPSEGVITLLPLQQLEFEPNRMVQPLSPEHFLNTPWRSATLHKEIKLLLCSKNTRAFERLLS